MYHRIEFCTTFMADLEVSPRKRLERLCLRKGDRVNARIVPHVLETAEGPVEAADLYLEDGTVLREVRFEPGQVEAAAAEERQRQRAERERKVAETQRLIEEGRRAEATR